MVEQIEVKFKKLNTKTQRPFRKHYGDAAYDIAASENIQIKANVPTKIPTGLVLGMPYGYYCELHTRSSHGIKGIRLHTGIIDQDYYGEIAPIMISPFDTEILEGERVGQLIFKKRIEVEFIETTEEFSSDRGTSGFGSTGK